MIALSLSLSLLVKIMLPEKRLRNLKSAPTHSIVNSILCRSLALAFNLIGLSEIFHCRSSSVVYLVGYP